MIGVVGDSSRDGEFALVRLRLEGDRIVEADAEGFERPLQGLTLLEAAAVPGERVAADALANALGQVFHATPEADRSVVALSGRGSTARAAPPAGAGGVGGTRRVLVRPAAPAAHRASCLP